MSGVVVPTQVGIEARGGCSESGDDLFGAFWDPEDEHVVVGDGVPGEALVSGGRAPLRQGCVNDDAGAAEFGEECDVALDGEESGGVPGGHGVSGQGEELFVVPLGRQGDDDVTAGMQQRSAANQGLGQGAQWVEVGRPGGCRGGVMPGGGQDEIDPAGESGEVIGAVSLGVGEHHALGPGAGAVGGGEVRPGQFPVPVVGGETDGVSPGAECFEEHGARAAVRVEHQGAGAGVVGDGVGGQSRRNLVLVQRGIAGVLAMGELSVSVPLTNDPHRRKRG